MAWKRSILVVANVTATSDELLDALKARAGRQPTRFTLVVPATPFGGGRQAAADKLFDAVDQLRAAGLEADGSVGDADPCIAVTESWDPKQHDEIIVSTLPQKMSKWLHAGLPARIARITGAPVTHLVSHPPKPEVETVPAPAHEDKGVVMGPLSVLSWGGNQSR
jgi:alkanesulfonate monooxygenase SsuD/methylene tetrahydromethanopterin reductase-like flavin-dependent oxidoreductase (luciferase family)